MTKTVNVIGNGNSNKYFSNNGHSVACNIPQHSANYNQLSIIDRQPLVYMKQSGWRPRTPVLCTEQIKEHARKMNLEGDWFPVYTATHRWNSGHHAVNYIAGLNQVEKIHLWGFDSMFSSDLLSQMDTLVPRSARPDLNRYWRPIWVDIFAKYSDTQFVIHVDREVDHLFYGHNVSLAYHSD